MDGNSLISVGEVMYRIQRNPLLANISKSEIVNQVKSVIGLIRAGVLYEDKVVKLLISDFRSQIPGDFVERTACRRILENQLRVTLGHNTDDAYKTYPSVTSEDAYAVDLLYTHKIVGGFLYVDFEVGEVELLYKAIRVDENGWPMLVNNESLIKAIEWAIKKDYYEILWETGNISQAVYQNAQQKYSWYIGQATNSLEMPDPVRAEALGNAIFRLIPQKDSFEQGHKYDSQKETLVHKRSYFR